MVRRRARMVIIKGITKWPLFTSQYVPCRDACQPEVDNKDWVWMGENSNLG